MAIIGGNQNNNTLFGDINGVAENDSIFGFDGNDTLFGLGGDDTLDGGAGADVINGGNGFDTVSYRGSTFGVFVDLNVNAGGGDTLFSIENVDGSNFFDVLFGDNNGTIGNRLRGFGGADSIEGFAGQDTLDGGDDNDIIFGGAGEDVVIGGAGSDFLDGDSGFDTASYATSTAGVTASLATGTASVPANNPAGVFNDALIEFEGLTGSVFNDQLTGDDGGNVLRGLNGSDVLNGLNGSDMLIGDGGGDQIDGGSGDDLVIGGGAGDVLTGGAGADTFDFNKVSESRAGLVGADSISDFVEGLDEMDLATIDANTGVAGDQAFRFIGTNGFSGTAGELRFQVDGVFTRVLGDVDGNGRADLQITLVDPLALTAGDFVL